MIAGNVYLIKVRLSNIILMLDKTLVWFRMLLGDVNPERVPGVALLVAVGTELGVTREVNLHVSLDPRLVLVRFCTIVALPFLAVWIPSHCGGNQSVEIFNGTCYSYTE